jgi:hypothetical protein
MSASCEADWGIGPRWKPAGQFTYLLSLRHAEKCDLEALLYRRESILARFVFTSQKLKLYSYGLTAGV